MDDDPVIDETSGERATSRVVIDAGGETWARVAGAIHRRMEDMAPGQMLEIVSVAATAQIDVSVWCHLTGHSLLRMTMEGASARFWIRKASEREREARSAAATAGSTGPGVGT